MREKSDERNFDNFGVKQRLKRRYENGEETKFCKDASWPWI